MVDCVDQGVGRVMQTLDELKLRDNTLVVFLNDNGASPNDRVRRGDFGTPGTNWNVGPGWAHLSNTPFKYYKRTQHSGGVTTPFIAHWPAGIKPRAAFEDQPCHFIDVLPTLIDVAGGSYPTNFGGKQHPPLPGRSFASILTKCEMLPSRTLHFALFNNLALIHDGWKIATAYSQPWQLYDLKNDRTETRDLAAERPEKLAELLALQKSLSRPARRAVATAIRRAGTRVCTAVQVGRHSRPRRERGCCR
jgi:arylsulfatase A-like enzyme